MFQRYLTFGKKKVQMKIRPKDERFNGPKNVSVCLFGSEESAVHKRCTFIRIIEFYPIRYWIFSSSSSARLFAFVNGFKS